MNQEMFNIWLQEVWRKRKNSLFSSNSLLIYDSARSHLTDEVKSLVKKCSKIAVIPAGLTKKLQPLDLSVNKSFKSKMRTKWEKWMVNGYHSFTKSGIMRRASYAEVCNWIIESWKDITTDCIRNGFKKASICDYSPNQNEECDDYEGTTEEELSDSESETQELPLNLINLFETFMIESDEDFDGFD
jgi:hypothetical protein